ncbi:phage holin family protein [Christensenella sp. MSJ-20]|uniref:phage holin family protein n=1 Tax=Christensenella sp. MSJ-20 TaxID=2841518 RepID=UPI001C766666|nr:phage holin family protein [Christensenella sp. MSJ-20]
MEILNDYIVVLVMAICLAVGYIIKHFLPMDNKWIPLIMGCLGVLINVWVNTWVFTPEVLLGGLASGLAATGAFEMVRNLVGNENMDV